MSGKKIEVVQDQKTSKITALKFVDHIFTPANIIDLAGDARAGFTKALVLLATRVELISVGELKQKYRYMRQDIIDAWARDPEVTAYLRDKKVPRAEALTEEHKNSLRSARKVVLQHRGGK